MEFLSGLTTSLMGGLQAQEVNRGNFRINKMQIANANAMQDKAQQYTLENMAAENQEWQRRFGHENQEWQRRYDLQNAYNTPAAQRERLESAGLNPYLLLNGGSAGVSQASIGTSSSSPAAHQGAQGSNPNLLPMVAGSSRGGLMDVLVSIASSIKDIRSARKDAAETQGINIDNVTRMRANLSKIANTIADTEGKRVSNNYQKMANEVMGQTLDTQIEQAKQNYQLTVQQTFLAQQQGLKVQMDMQYLPQQYQAQIDWLAQQVAESQVREAVHKTQAALNKSNITRNEVENQLTRQLVEYYKEAGINQAAQALHAATQAMNLPHTEEQCKEYIEKTIELKAKQVVTEDARAGFYNAAKVEAYANAGSAPVKAFAEAIKAFKPSPVSINVGDKQKPRSNPVEGLPPAPWN